MDQFNKHYIGLYKEMHYFQRDFATYLEYGQEMVY